MMLMIGIDWYASVREVSQLVLADVSSTQDDNDGLPLDVRDSAVGDGCERCRSRGLHQQAGLVQSGDCTLDFLVGYQDDVLNIALAQLIGQGACETQTEEDAKELSGTLASAISKAVIVHLQGQVKANSLSEQHHNSCSPKHCAVGHNKIY